MLFNNSPRLMQVSFAESFGILIAMAAFFLITGYVALRCVLWGFNTSAHRATASVTSKSADRLACCIGRAVTFRLDSHQSINASNSESVFAAAQAFFCWTARLKKKYAPAATVSRRKILPNARTESEEEIHGHLRDAEQCMRDHHMQTRMPYACGTVAKFILYSVMICRA